MRISEVDPEILFGKGKNLRIGRRIEHAEFLQQLNVTEKDQLFDIVNDLSFLANSSLHVLGVGNLTQSHCDIDLLIYLDDQRLRNNFLEKSIAYFDAGSRYWIEKRSIQNGRDIFCTTKYFLKNTSDLKNVIFDLTHLGECGGSWDDVLYFHSANSLLHCVLS